MQEALYLGAVDLGSSSFKLSLASVLPDAQFVERNIEASFRIPYRLDLKSPFQKDRFLPLLLAFKAASALFKAYQVHAYSLGATSFFRDYQDADKLFDWLYEETGMHAMTLSAEQEAKITWRALEEFLPLEQPSRWILDIGGGSTELIFQEGKEIRCSSFNIGALRLKKATEKEFLLQEWQRFVEQQLIEHPAKSLVVLGGGAQILGRYLPKFKQTKVKWGDRKLFLDELAKLPTKDFLRAYPMPLDKLESLPCFIQILEQFLDAAHLDCFLPTNLGLTDGLLFHAFSRATSKSEDFTMFEASCDLAVCS